MIHSRAWKTSTTSGRTKKSKGGVFLLGGRKVYDKIRSLSKRKLDALEYEHRQHLQTFSDSKQSKGEEAQGLEKKYNKLATKAHSELSKGDAGSQAYAMGIAMEMRHVRADLMIARSVRTILRANEFYHRMMVVLIQDTKSGVDYNPERIEELIPAEFSDMIDKSIISTDLSGLLDELKQEISSMGGE